MQARSPKSGTGSKKVKGEPSQADKFKRAARELEADDSDETFRRAIRKIGAVKPAKPKKGKKRKKPN